MEEGVVEVSKIINPPEIGMVPSLLVYQSRGITPFSNNPLRQNFLAGVVTVQLLELYQSLQYDEHNVSEVKGLRFFQVSLRGLSKGGNHE